MRRDMNEYQNMDVLPMATAQKVKTMIIQREMKPGDRLPTEKELADLLASAGLHFGEAMKFLRAENVVVIRQGSGTFVSAGTGDWGRPLGLHFTNQEKLIQNLFETRMLIEPQIAGLACQRATPQDVRNLQLLVTEMDRSEVNSPASAELDVQFHTAVAECTHNEVLIRVVPSSLSLSARSHVETHDEPESFKRAEKPRGNL
ncbi:MAG: FadR/GntR family transcriptional regulator [Enterocloster clostridioformis]